MRALRVMVAIGLMTLVGGALTTGVAGAQDSGDAITVEQTHPLDDGAHYFVRVEGATGDTTVTATATGPDGKAGDPATLTGDDSGLYQGAVTMPEDGDWKVTFTAKDPDATLEIDQTIPVGESSGSSGSGSDSGSSADSGDDEPSPTGPLIFAGLFVLALIGMGIWALIERGKTPADSDSDSSTSIDAGDDSSADAGADDESSVSTSTE